MRIPTPLHAPTGWRRVAACRVLLRQRRPSSEVDDIVTAFRDGHVTARANRRTEGFTNAIQELGYQGIQRGDLVVHSMDGFAGAIGVSDSDGKASPVVHAYSVAEAADARYLAYLLRTFARVGFITSLARGIRERSTAFDPETLGSLELSLPPILTQRAIADYLDGETARIDALIAAKKRMVSLLLTRWRTAVSQRMHSLMKHHGTIPLRHLVSCLDGRRVPLSAEERASRTGAYPYYGASSIVDFVDDYLFDETLVLLGEDGAQLADPEYAIAQVVTGKLWVNNHAHVLRPIRVDPIFLSLHLNTFDRVAFMSGGTREKITQDDMNRILVPNLSVPLQVTEGQRLEQIRINCDSACVRLNKQIALLREHRQALITAAVTGELDIPEAA